MVVSGQWDGMVGGGCVAYLGTCIPSCLYISSPPFSIPLPQLLFPSQGPMDRLGTVQGASRSVVVELKTTQCVLPRLAEFQTPTIFDCDCDLICSKAYRHSKIVKWLLTLSAWTSMYILFYFGREQSFSHYNCEIHSKHQKQAIESFIAPHTGL